jgi:uncharacterized membrane protein
MNVAALNPYQGATNTATLEVAATTNSRSLFERINSAVSQILSFVTTTALFFISPTLFAIGTVWAVCDETRVTSLVERIENAWDRQQWQIKALLVVGALTALPVAVSGLALFEGAKFGLALK